MAMQGSIDAGNMQGVKPMRMGQQSPSSMADKTSKAFKKLKKMGKKARVKSAVKFSQKKTGASDGHTTVKAAKPAMFYSKPMPMGGM